MPRKRKPSNLLEFTGAFAKNPQRLAERANEASDERELGEPPDGLDSAVTQAWHDIVDTSVPGVLKRRDRLAVEMAARAICAARLSPMCIVQARLALAELGMTPASASKVVKTNDAKTKIETAASV